MDIEQAIAAYPQRTCASDNGVVSWREAGSGPAIVLLHGISSGSASWIHQLAGLEPSQRVIAWDAPGYGQSSRLADEAPLASGYANVLERLVDTLSLDAFTLVGHSLGALMAAAYAQVNPERVKRLVLMSPARGYALADPAERRQKYDNRMAKLERLGPEGLARERASALLSSTASRESVECVAWNMRRIDPTGYQQAARMLAEDDLGRYAYDFRKPVRVVSGDADQITPVDKCRAVASQFPDASYEAISGLGHALYLEKPERINPFLREQAEA